MKDLEMDELVNISSISEQVFTEVFTSLEKIKLVKTQISNKQLTALLTHVLNQGQSVSQSASETDGRTICFGNQSLNKKF